MSEAKRTLVSLNIQDEWTAFTATNTPGTGLTETLHGDLLFVADDETPLWRHKAGVLRRAANLLNALADDIEDAQTEDKA